LREQNGAVSRSLEDAQQIVFNPMFDEAEHLEFCANKIMPHL
jgi:hypothetical protein